MSVTSFQASQASQTDRVRITLPEDSYQCVIEKVELREGKKYMSEETEQQLLFYLKPFNVSKEFETKVLFYQTTTSFFNGVSQSSKVPLKASKLYNLIKTIYKFYKPEVKVENMKAVDLTPDTINDLEGKQIMAIVKIAESGANKITDILPIKAEIKSGVVPETKSGMTASEELEAALAV